MKENKLKNVLSILFFVLSLIVLVGGLVFIILGSLGVKETPQNLSVQTIDGKYYLTTEHQEKYSYYFKIEQKTGDDYGIVIYAHSDTNVLDLSAQPISLNAGNKFRFSVCYDAGNNTYGKFCEPIEWVVTYPLASVDVNSVTFEEGLLTWEGVNYADYYIVQLFDVNDLIENYQINQTSLDLSDLTSGSYTIFIKACSNSYYTASISDSFAFQVN